MTDTPDLTPEAVERLAKSLAFVANRTGMTVEKCERVTDDAAATLRALSARVAELEGLAWIEGIPPKPWSSEWFIAETVGGAKVALFPLPEEWSYDFKTADETYFCASRIKRWMQFPDSEYVSFAADRIAALSARVAELEGARDRWKEAYRAVASDLDLVVSELDATKARAAMKGGAA